MFAIAAKELFFLYRAGHGDVAALRGLSLHVAEGEVVSVLGPSGSGKTTLLGLCEGSLSPSSGELSVLGIDAAQRSQLVATRRSLIGVVRQHYHRSLPADLTVGEIVGLPLRFLGFAEPRARKRASALLQAAGLGRQADARTFELSGGEQQRVAVCAALAKNPRLILADEPTGELDARMSVEVIELLLELAEESRAAALIVTHDDEIALRTPRTIHVRDGRLAAEGATDPVLVIDEYGWLRLPENLRVAAGVGEHVRASAQVGRIELAAEAGSLPVLKDGPSGASRAEGILTDGPRRPTATTVTLDGVRKSFGRETVFDGLSHVFAPGKLHIVAGPSGSGKTTLLNLIAALDRPDAGQVRIAGERVDRLERDEAARWRQRSLGYISQHSTLAGSLSARENVEIALLIRDASPERARAVADRWLSWVGLGSMADRRGDRLSGGEQRRIALARAVAPIPSILLADEPTAHLDRLSGRAVIDLVREAARLGMTVVAATHDLDLISAADETYFLAGRA